MSHATTTDVQDQRPETSPEPRKDGLSSRSLPRWAPLGFAALGIALGVGISLAADWHSRVQWGLISALLLLAISYVATTVVENQRQANDRLPTTIVWVCFLVAVVPLAPLLWTTISRGS